MLKWSKWRAFPDPRKGESLTAPFGPGVYQLRNRATREMVLCGCGVNCAGRMTSLLPPPHGSGTRKNNRKRAYVLLHIDDVDYRCWACTSSEDLKAIENSARLSCTYLFPT